MPDIIILHLEPPARTATDNPYNLEEDCTPELVERPVNFYNANNNMMTQDDHHNLWVNTDYTSLINSVPPCWA
jgi:hypothetical protein